MNKIIITVVLWLALITRASAQISIGAGIGYDAHHKLGVISASVQSNKIGGYFTQIYDGRIPRCYNVPKDNPISVYNEFTFGLAYEVYSEYPKIALTGGVGRSTVTKWYNDYTLANSYVSDDYYTMCYEGGVTIKPFKSCPWLNLSGMFNTNSMFKTLVVFTYTFKNL